METNEIIELVKNIEKADAIAQSNHPDLEKSKYFQNFMADNAQKLLICLYELGEILKTSSSSEGGQVLSKQSRFIVEGFSDENASLAFSDALSKAAKYFSEAVDINITLKQLTELKSGGHRATLELHITPITLKNRAHVKSLDIENKKFRDAEFRKALRDEEGERRHLVFDHFVPKMGSSAAGIPDNFLINIGDAYLMNYMIEKAFFKAGHTPPHPNQIVIRTLEQEEESPSPS
ncbi:MAG: hypothetical protein RBR86_01045 [Pseudobdellovibrionaceae bacterium]|jgi:hypothetical protein|nr:hypothetical protein [Pseudobdellovibrionaceae bacterium]